MLRKIVKALIPKKIFELVEPWGHWAEAVLANLAYGFPARGLNVIGVTGTDGKTTTSTLVAAMLRNAGYQVGYITTISIDDGSGPKPNPTRLTAVTSFNLFRQIRIMKRKGVQWLVLETTSHALAQHRYWGVPYSVAVMTNVTHEHLDYHRTFERYRDAKLKLFKITGKNQQGLGVGVANAEDGAVDLFAGAVRKAITYGITKGDLRAADIKSTPVSSDFKVNYEGKSWPLHVNVPGSFNVYNALAAAGVGLALGLEPIQIQKGIASLESVEGRMNTIDEGQDFNVIVDYAHTPDSFKKIFAELRPLAKGRLIAVFGSAGRRDAAKRAIQGETAGQMADIVVVTEEDDRDEDGLAIMHAIADGAKKAGKKFDHDLFEIHNRAEAIDYAVKLAKPGDTVVLLGKGHEKSIIGPSGKRPWDEASEARKALKNLRS